MESYQTIQNVAEGRIVQKKSDFIAYISPAESEQHAIDFLEKIRTNHRTANHIVYAYSLREGARQRYSDDGEPAKTAGLPVLGVLTHANVVDCILVVARYFGGTLLGTGGLVRAYTGAGKAALEASQIVTIQRCIPLTMVLEYPLYEQALRILETHGASWETPVFTDNVEIKATLPYGKEAALMRDLNECSRGQAVITVGEPLFLPF